MGDSRAPSAGPQLVRFYLQSGTRSSNGYSLRTPEVPECRISTNWTTATSRFWPSTPSDLDPRLNRSHSSKMYIFLHIRSFWSFDNSQTNHLVGWFDPKLGFSSSDPSPRIPPSGHSRAPFTMASNTEVARGSGMGKRGAGFEPLCLTARRHASSYSPHVPAAWANSVRTLQVSVGQFFGS